MQIHRIRHHERDFTVLANKAIRDPRLSHTARGILAYVLSLPSGAHVNVRTLSDGFPQGRLAVSKAVKELRELGYWVTQTERDSRTRQIISSVDVYEVPQATSSPQAPQAPSAPSAPRSSTPRTHKPVPTRVGTGSSGPFSSRGYTADLKTEPLKDGGKNPPLPPAGAAATVDEPHAAESAGILWRLGSVDPRLRLTERGVRELVPEVVVWLERGASAAEIVDAVTAGLPAKVYSAVRLIADRLSRKRPERKRAWRQVFECPECRDPLPWGQETGICRACSARAASADRAPSGSGREETRRLLQERAA
ncbi:hypothetical protein ACIBUY_10865 [Streptomyces sp. NPDC050085]|uniref:hypothetical protein n=1 Tax=Streptomyces sp. NPDC050085 TaxID=3365600 RepID=UPI0037934288